MEVVPFRLPRDLVRRLDRLRDRMEKSQPGITRADVVRVLLVRGLEEEERHGA